MLKTPPGTTRPGIGPSTIPKFYGGRSILSGMNVGEFEDLIDRLGDDLSTWPEGARLLAQLLLSSSPDAQKLLREAQALRQALSKPALSAPAGLADRIVNAAHKSTGPAASNSHAEIAGAATPHRNPSEGEK